MKDDLYHWYKDFGICPGCKVETAAPGKVYCEVCAAKNAERAQRKWENITFEQKKEKKRKNLASHKMLYERRKKAGLCVRCGKDGKGRLTCVECAIKKRRYSQRYRMRRAENDLRRVLGHPELQKERELPKAPTKESQESEVQR